MQDRNAIRQTLIQILSEETNTSVDGIGDDTALQTGLGLDSVDFVGVIMRIESEYRIRLTHEELSTISTVGDLVTMIQQKATAALAAA